MINFLKYRKQWNKSYLYYTELYLYLFVISVKIKLIFD